MPEFCRFWYKIFMAARGSVASATSRSLEGQATVAVFVLFLRAKLGSKSSTSKILDSSWPRAALPRLSNRVRLGDRVDLASIATAVALSSFAWVLESSRSTAWLASGSANWPPFSMAACMALCSATLWLVSVTGRGMLSATLGSIALRFSMTDGAEGGFTRSLRWNSTIGFTGMPVVGIWIAILPPYQSLRTWPN